MTDLAAPPAKLVAPVFVSLPLAVLKKRNRSEKFGRLGQRRWLSWSLERWLLTLVIRSSSPSINMNTTSGNRTDKNNERAGVGQTKKKFRKDNKPEGCEATSSRFNQEIMNQGILFSARKFSFQAFSNQLT